MRASFVRMQWENRAQTIASFLFEPSGQYRYEAGQYSVFTIPHHMPDNRGTSRTMTLSSSPTEDLLKITLRLFGNEGSSFKRALIALHPGDEVTIFESMGDLVLPLDTSQPLLFVAGGVGVASYVGMMQWLLDKRQQRDITLLYAVSRPDDIILQQPFDAYAGRYPLTKQLYTPIVNSAYDFIGDIIRGHLSGAAIVPYIRPETLVYLSGPENMVTDLLVELKTDGVSNQQIIFDYFEGYTGI
jgi:ferredoxin-NADP reductase